MLARTPHQSIKLCFAVAEAVGQDGTVVGSEPTSRFAQDQFETHSFPGLDREIALVAAGNVIEPIGVGIEQVIRMNLDKDIFASGFD